MRRRQPARLLDDATQKYRLKYEYCIILKVVGATSVISRFLAEGDKRLAEGREGVEAVIAALRTAGLMLKTKKHLAKDGSKYVFAFVGADTKRLQLESQRVAIERWLQEEGIGALQSSAGAHSCAGAQGARGAKPTMRVVRVGGLHFFAPADGAEGSDAPEQQPAAARPPSTPSLRLRTPGAGGSTPSAAAATPGGSGGGGGGFAPNSAARVELLEHILHAPASQGGAGLVELTKADRRGTIAHVFPLHDHRFNRRLRRKARYLNPFCGGSRDAFVRDVKA